MNDSVARVLRTLAQLIAGGGLTLLFDQFAKDVPTRYAPYVVLGATLLVSVCQNLVEEWKGTGVLRQSSPPAAKDAEAIAKV